MPGIDLHLFVDDLKSGASGTSNKPPRSIKAKDLDENFKKASVIADTSEPNSYTMEYGEDGTILKIFPSINSSGTYVLGTIDGKLTWIETQDCEDTTTPA